MTFDEAVELARAIEGNSQFAVIAIGRFVMMTELSNSIKQTMSWGVSVVALSDRTDRVVCHHESEWIAFASVYSKPKTKPSDRVKADEPCRASEEQLSLF